MIKLICVGKIKEKYLLDAITEYQKRISKYTDIKLIELKDYNLEDIHKSMELEKEEVEKYLDRKDYIITLEIEGKEISSMDFSKVIDKAFTSYSNISFIIGGSNGLSESVKQKANYHLSFSKMTFPHQLFRVLLLEQIFRAYKINNNERYHK